jgi:hypothetical protein
VTGDPDNPLIPYDGAGGAGRGVALADMHAVAVETNRKFRAVIEYEAGAVRAHRRRKPGRRGPERRFTRPLEPELDRRHIAAAHRRFQLASEGRQIGDLWRRDEIQATGRPAVVAAGYSAASSVREKRGDNSPPA